MACVLGANRFRGKLKVGQRPILGEFPIAQPLVTSYRGSACTAMFSHCPIKGMS
jgi:hypothetical protein